MSKEVETPLTIPEQVEKAIIIALDRNKGKKNVSMLISKNELTGLFFGLYLKDGKEQMQILDRVCNEINTLRGITIETPFEVENREGYYSVEFSLATAEKVRKKAARKKKEVPVPDDQIPTPDVLEPETGESEPNEIVDEFEFDFTDDETNFIPEDFPTLEDEPEDAYDDFEETTKTLNEDEY